MRTRHVLINLAVLLPALAQDTVTVRPREIDTVFANPGIGLVTYQSFNADRGAQPPAARGRLAAPMPPSTLAYFRMYWSAIEPAEGKYDWSAIDKALAGAREHGQTLMLRVAPYGPDNDVPAWYRKLEAASANLLEKSWRVDPDNPNYAARFGGMIKELGKRYDGNPDLELVDVAIVGPDGDGAGSALLKPETRAALLDCYLDSFRKTPLAMQPTDERTNRYALRKAAAGWRADHLGDLRGFESGGNHMVDFYPAAIADFGLRDAWKKGPVAMEAQGTLDQWKENGWSFDYIIEQSLKWHISSFNAKSSAVPPDMRAALNGWLKKMGYRFVLRKFEYPASVEREGGLAFRSVWENEGVAPIYRNYPVALRLKGAGGAAVLVTGADIRKWLPGDNTLDHTLYLPAGVKEGEYDLALALVDPATRQPKVKLAIEGAGDDGWYPMGRLRVTAPAPAKQAAAAAKPKPAAGAKEQPAEMKAFTDALAVKEPQKKIEALQKYMAAYPKSSMARQANQAILDTLIKNSPTESKRILAQANAMVKAADEESRGQVQGSIAARLLDAGILMKDAEKYGKDALATMDQAKYLARMKQRYAGRKQQPSEQDMLERFRTERAGYQSTLGNIYLKAGKTKDAEALLKQAHEASPTLVSATMGLADLAEKSGDVKAALDYVALVRVGGAAAPEVRSRLEGLYRKAHNGSTDGFDDMLDAVYQKRFPLPMEPEAYKPGPGRSDRTVLVEVFTGSGCPPCAGADIGFDIAMERYARQDVAVLMYHQHVPRPDPMSNLDSQKRAAYYAVRGVPTYAIDGKDKVGGGSRDMAKEFYERTNPDIERELQTPAGGELHVDASRDGGTVRVRAAFERTLSDSPDLRLHVALAEKRIRYSGENGVRFHPFVVRSLARGGDGYALGASKSMTVEDSFDIAKVAAGLKAHLDDFEVNNTRFGKFEFIEKKDKIDSNNLAVVVFVQDEKTKEIIQAAYTDLEAR
jgi:thiol-disulfide isomerase/thioredoxin